MRYREWKGLKLELNTQDVILVKQNVYPNNPIKREILAEHIQIMKDNEVIEYLKSSWTSLIVLASKKTRDETLK